jgi:hypothetical protein
MPHVLLKQPTAGELTAPCVQYLVTDCDSAAATDCRPRPGQERASVASGGPPLDFCSLDAQAATACRRNAFLPPVAAGCPPAGAIRRKERGEEHRLKNTNS